MPTEGTLFRPAYYATYDNKRLEDMIAAAEYIHVVEELMNERNDRQWSDISSFRNNPPVMEL